MSCISSEDEYKEGLANDLLQIILHVGRKHNSTNDILFNAKAVPMLVECSVVSASKPNVCFNYALILAIYVCIFLALICNLNLHGHSPTLHQPCLTVKSCCKFCSCGRIHFNAGLTSSSCG